MLIVWLVEKGEKETFIGWQNESGSIMNCELGSFLQIERQDGGRGVCLARAVSFQIFLQSNIILKFELCGNDVDDDDGM